MGTISKILISGGHPAPAIAFIDVLLVNRPSCEVIFAGRKYNNYKEKSISFEFKEIQKRKIPFYQLDAGRFTRIFSLSSIKNLLLIPLGVLQACSILFQTKPDVVFTFGGYLGFSIGCASWLLRIPIYTHEQTIHPGFANRFIAGFAKKIFISFEHSQKYFSHKKTIISGNIVRKNIFNSSALSHIKIDKSKPCIYITGGSLGSHAINVLIEKIITDLLGMYSVIHQTGNIEEYGDYIRLQKIRKSLPIPLQNSYYLTEHINNDEIGYVYSLSDIVISRCGANTWFELVALKKPAILIPLPWSAYGEQWKQASILDSIGAAKIFEQKDSSDNLFKLIQLVLKNKQNYASAYNKISGVYKANAADTILQEIFT